MISKFKGVIKMLVNVNSNGSNLIAINEVKMYDGGSNNVKECKKYTIGIDITNGRTATMSINPYFKIYDGNFEKSKSCARIDLRTGAEVIHSDGKKRLKITKDIIDWLDEVLDYQCTNNSYSQYSVYEALWAFAISRNPNPNSVPKHCSKSEFIKIMRNRYL